MKYKIIHFEASSMEPTEEKYNGFIDLTMSYPKFIMGNKAEPLRKNIVYLICIEINKEKNSIDEVFVTSNMICASFFIESFMPKSSMGINELTLHIQEYYSFEDAYRVALDMKEEDPLCYDKSTELN